ncbi:MAG: outer membrane beta-barrel protein [Bacteroidales bacterium]|nr:outer membrane beta-barrel protein [Bacteroidales bacterium]
MKKQSLQFLVLLFMGVSLASFAQDEIISETISKPSSSDGKLKKGEFHIGIQGFGTTSFSGGSDYTTFNPRIGYMVSNHDMIFMDFQYTWITGFYQGSEYDLKLNYRRYFGELKIKPFVQGGVGIGYANLQDIRYNNQYERTYLNLSTGVGVSYRYKRWSFEVGLNTEIKHGRIYLQPKGGVSISF